MHFYVEAERFCAFVRAELGRGRALSAPVAEALRNQAAELEERLEASHTGIHSPLRRAPSARLT